MNAGLEMRRLVVLLICAVLWLGSAPAMAEDDVVVEIDLSDQVLRVTVAGALEYEWATSTARPGYRTPVGSYRPIRLERYWRSRKYNNAPMPYSIFFRGGYAIHGTTEIKRLGRPVSHGCVRLHPDNAKVLFELVREYGAKNTLIRVVP